MIDYEVEKSDFINIVSGIEEDLFEILLKYVKGEINLHKARNKVLQKSFILHNYMHEHIAGKEYNIIKNNSLRNYRETEYHKNHEAARLREEAILKEIKEREKEDSIDMRKNMEHIDVPSIPGDFVTEEKTYTYNNRMDELLLEMAALVKEGHEIQWSENKRWCKIDEKVFNVHKNVWDLRKNEVL